MRLPSPLSRGRFLGLLLLVTTVAFSLRVALADRFVGLDSPPDAGAHYDQVDYEALADHLAAGRGYIREDGRPTAFRSPGTALTLAPVYVAAGRERWLGRLWFSLLSAATCALAGLLTARALGHWPGVLAATFLALHPGHAYYALHFLSETPFAFWLTLAALLADHGLRGEGSRRAAGLAGLALGLAVLTRPQALLVLPLAGIVPLLAPAATRRRRVPLALLVLGTVLPLGLWVARNQVQLGHAVVSTVGGCTFWGAHNEVVVADPGRIGDWIEVTSLPAWEQVRGDDEVEVDRRCWEQGKAFVRDQPGLLPRLVGWKLVRLFDPLPFPTNPLLNAAIGLTWLVQAPLLLIGLVFLRRRDRLLFALVVLPLLSLLATTVLFYGSARFRQGYVGLLVVPAAAGAAALVERIRGRREPAA